MLARTWGLFGGALEPSQDPATAAPPAPSAVSNDGADARGTGPEEAGGGSGRDGQRVPRLQVSVPVRATPRVTGLGHYHPEVHGPEGGKRDPPQVLATGDDDRRDDDSDDGSGSPELTMMFIDEPEGRRPEAAAAGQAGTETSERERRVR